MRLLSVMPLSKAFGADTLSYYTTKDVEVGAIVKIPLRKKTLPGLVIASAPLKEAKSEIRSADFSVKKITSVVTGSFFLPELIDAAKNTAHLHATHTGNVLSVIAPKSILEKTPTYDRPKAPSRTSGTKPLKRILQAEANDRYTRYKSMVRESFARGQSVFVLAPSIFHAETVFEVLSKGIEERSVMLSSTLTPKTLRGAWEEAVTSITPVLIVATYSFLSVPRADIGLYIVENESSPNYKLRGRPHLDVRVLVECIAESMHAELVYGDTFLTLETLYRHDEHEFESIMHPSMKRMFRSTCEVIHMKKGPDDEGKSPVVLSDTAIEALREASGRGVRSFVYAVRRGFAPLTICKDCGKTLACDRCDAPMVLYQKTNEKNHRSFHCHRCGRIRDAHTVCDNCEGWRLEPLGLGVERVVEALRKALPDVPLFEIHGGVEEIEKDEEHIALAWKESKNGILIGTERALPHLARTGAHTSVIASIDSLFALPDFRMSEKIFSLLCDIRSLTRTQTLIQTRSPDAPVLAHVVSGDGLAFYRNELELRQTHGYPPYTAAVKITRIGARDAITNELETLAKEFAPRNTAVYPAFIGSVKNQASVNLLITIPYGRWPDRDLLLKLLTLSPAYDVDVNPRSFL
ncbi:MAG: hypothetical protein AAB458_00425 [Patescibacteria group bacterium]